MVQNIALSKVHSVPCYFHAQAAGVTLNSQLQTKIGAILIASSIMHISHILFQP